MARQGRGFDPRTDHHNLLLLVGGVGCEWRDQEKTFCGQESRLLFWDWYMAKALTLAYMGQILACKADFVLTALL
jgi:hypothetical protein